MLKQILIVFLATVALAASASPTTQRGSASDDASAQPAPARRLQADDVRVLGAAHERALRPAQGQNRVESRSLVTGGAAVYVVLADGSADVRVTETTPRFLLSVAADAEADDAFELTRLETRRNERRELLVGHGGGATPMSIGLSRGREIPVTILKATDQDRAAAGCVLYEAVPREPLAPGEYAWVRGLRKASDSTVQGVFYTFSVEP